MTKDEFLAKSSAMSAAYTVRILIDLGLFLGALSAAALIGNYYEKHHHISWTAGAFFVWLVLTGAIFLFSLVQQGKKLARRFGLRCPACGGSLADSPKVVTLTGNCSHCGTQVLSDISSIETQSGQLSSRRQFVSQFGALYRKDNHRQSILVVIVWSAIFACVPLARYLNHLATEGKLDWAGALPVIRIEEILSGLLLLAIGAAFVCSVASKRKRTGILCPRCHKPLFGDGARVAIATHRCPYCGETILD